MDLELLFSVAGVLAMVGWIALLASPLIPLWSDRIAGMIIPLLLSGGYVVLIVFSPSANEGGFGSLADVVTLFSHPHAMLAGWIHYLAFDLLVGAWICRAARRDRIRFWWVLPCLPVTFLLGPAGFVAFSIIRLLSSREGAVFFTKRTNKVPGKSKAES